MSTARTLPIWDSLQDLSASCFRADFPANAQPDVAVVGAGIAGLVAAVSLLQDGRRVMVIDRAGFGQGESLRTTAHLASALDDRYTALARWHGRDGAELAAASHAAAIDWLETFCAGVDGGCGFRRLKGYLFAHDGNAGRLAEECDAARQAGLWVRLLRAGLPDCPQLGPVLEFDRQARVDMDRLLAELAETARVLGASFVRAQVEAVEGGEPVVLTLEGGTRVQAGAALIATNVPFHERVAMHTKQSPYRTYVVAGPCEAGALPDALLWDDADPYHYARLVADRGRPGGWWAVVGGEDHKTGQNDDPGAYVRLQAWARELFPQLQSFTYAWSGQILEPVDGLGYVGADPGGLDHVYVITGDSGNGVTHGTLGGLLVSDLIAGRPNPWAALYDPKRKPVKAGLSWVRENANVAAQYRDWLAGGGAPSVDALALGEGAVIRDGMHRVAVYRDGDGELHAFSARCPHLGCSVRWSPQEKSWDCPCHGSRFDARSGQVLNGPSVHPLEPVDARVRGP